MSDKKLFNVRLNEDLKEAIRVVAFNQGHSNNSKTVVEALQKNPEISKALKAVAKIRKNKVG